MGQEDDRVGVSEIAESVPERLWLSRLTTKGTMIMIKGSALDNDLVALFLRNLSQSKSFTEVDLDQTEMGRSKGDLQLVEFSIRAVLVNPDSKESGDQA